MERLWAALDDPAWFGESPDRTGFVDLERYSDSIIMGYFAIEKPLHIVQYDEEKHREERDEESFEHIWFALFLGVGRLVAQRRKFIRRRLKAEEVLQRLREALALKFLRLNIPILEFKPYERVIEKERFLEEFALGGVQELRIHRLTGTRVPDSTVLFNPDVNKDEILREVLNQDNRQIESLAIHATRDGDLHKAKIARGEIAAGEPHLLRRQDSEGRTIILHSEIRETITIAADLDETRSTPSEMDKERLVAEVEERPLPRRRPPENPGQTSFFAKDDAGDHQ